jgi:hypothetical protein
MSSAARSALWVAIALGALAAPLSAQRGPARIPASQLGEVSQEIAGTTIEIRYRRPVARGRELFGMLVPWDRIWTPSADSAARITISGPVEVNGQELAAGSYGIWTIPGAAEWTVIFNRVAEVFHLRYPPDQDVLRVTSVPTQGEHTETLTFAFPVADADSTLLQLRWGTTVVPLTLRARR